MQSSHPVLPDFSLGETANVSTKVFERLGSGKKRPSEFLPLGSDPTPEPDGLSPLSLDLDSMGLFEQAEDPLIDISSLQTELSDDSFGLDPLASVQDTAHSEIELDVLGLEGTVEDNQNETIVQDLTKHHEDQIQELENRHKQEVIDVLNGLYSQMEVSIGQMLEEKLTAVLGPIVGKKLERDELEKFSKDAVRLVQKGAISRCKLTGPQHLIDQVFSSLQDLGFELETLVNDQPELTAQLDDQIISTSLQGWTERLEALACNA